MSNKGNNGGKKVNNNAEISVKKNDKKLGEVTIDPKLKSELIDENVAEFKKKDLNAKENLKNKKEEVKKDVKSESLNKKDVFKNSNEDSKSKKDVSKGIKGIIVVIFIFLILFVVSKVLSNNQERLLNKAVNELASKNVVTTNFHDERINNVGEYKIVAETIKEFLVKYSDQMKEIQNDLQTRNKKADIINFKKDVNTISISKEIGKQAMLNGTMGLGIGMATNIGINLITGKEVEVKEVIEAGIKTGTFMGMATAVAGAIRVAVEKKVIPTIFSRALTNNTIGIIAAVSMDIIGITFKLGSGEITLSKAVKDIGILISSAYGTMISSNIVYNGTKLIMGMIGMGTIGGLGTLIVTVVSVIIAAVFEIVGSKICSTITNSLERIREKIIYESLEVVKDEIANIKNIAFGIIDKYKKIGEKLIPGSLK